MVELEKGDSGKDCEGRVATLFCRGLYVLVVGMYLTAIFIVLVCPIIVISIHAGWELLK